MIDIALQRRPPLRRMKLLMSAQNAENEIAFAVIARYILRERCG